MRLTLTLCKFKVHRAVKNLWKERGYVRSLPVIKPWYLADKDVVNPNYVDEHPRPPRWEPPEDIHMTYDVRSKPTDHPDYHEMPVYEYHLRSRLIEGLNQACILTKTRPFFELPQSIADYVAVADIPDQDLLVQRYIMQANIWDPTKDKLPRRINKHLPGWRFKAEYGIPQTRIRSVLTRNLVRLCQSIAGRYPDLLYNRDLLHDPYVSLHYTFQGDKPIFIHGMHEFLVTSTQPLQPFASTEVIDESVTFDLPDLYPLVPTIDLKKQHTYRDGENITGFKAGYKFSHPHTLFLGEPMNRAPDEKRARILMYCFANCLAHAKARYGENVKKIPEPITMQCISTNGTEFNFACFQLNTTNFDSSDGVKNLIWFDTGHNLYNKILPERAMLRNTKYEDYDPEVFKKILGFYLSGGDLSVKELEPVHSLG